MTMTSLDIAASPRALSPVGRGDTLSLSIPSVHRRESHDSDTGTSRSQSVRMDVSGPPTDSEEIEEDGVRALPKERARTGPVDDEAGPRFGVEDASKDSRAKAGEAGHSGIYGGDEVRYSFSFFHRLFISSFLPSAPFLRFFLFPPLYHFLVPDSNHPRFSKLAREAVTDFSHSQTT